MEYTPITEFDTQLETALNTYVSVRDRMIESENTLESILEASTPIEIDYKPPINMGNYIYDVEGKVSYVRQLQSLHKFAKLDKEQRVLLFAGNDVERIVGTKNYTIRTADTPESIETNNNVSWQKIMQFNNISPLDLIPGQEIVIPYNRNDVTADNIFLNNPVFDSHVGSKALGADIENEPTLDIATNDVNILSHADTFSQGITTLLSTAPGEIPDHNTYGLDLEIGKDFPDGAKERFIEMRIKQGCATDPRIEEVRSIQIERVQSGYEVTLVIKPINSNSFREFIDVISS